MSEIDRGNSSAHEAFGYPDAGNMRAKAEYVMKVGMFLQTGHLSQIEAAQKLGLSAEELSEVLRGQSRDLTVARISEYLNQPKDQHS